MSSTTLTRPTAPSNGTLVGDSAPSCIECEVDLQPVGAGLHLYWTCAYCGATEPRL